MESSQIELLQQQLWAAEQAIEKANRETAAEKQARDIAEQALGKVSRERDIAERQSRKTTLLEYLDAIHVYYSYTLTVRIDRTKATKGLLLNMTGKYCPTDIKAWNGFPEKQNAIWKRLERLGGNVNSSRVFDPVSFIKTFGARYLQGKIVSESDLEMHDQCMIQEPVLDIMSYFSNDADIKEEMHMKSSITFENQSNPLTHNTGLDQSFEAHFDKMQVTQSNPPPLLTNTNRLCVYQTEDEKPIPCFVVEYIAPHKLTIPQLKAGLRPMNPWNEIFNSPEIPPNNDGEATFVSRSIEIVAAVVTQTFSYMIEGGLAYAYICTGEAFIFLNVQPDDPTTVYYYLITPNDDVGDSTGWGADSDGPNRLHLTAVGQVLAFTLQTLLSRQQNSDWIKKAKRHLNLWAVDPQSLLNQVPDAARKDIENSACTPPQQMPSEYRSPLFLRSDKLNLNKASGSDSDETLNDGDKFDDEKYSDEEDENDHRTVGVPSVPSQTLSRNQGASKRITAESYDRWYERKEQCRAMAYCTQGCLRGLLNGGLLDETCPNVETHRKRDNYHCLNPSTFRELMRKQLSESLVTDCHALDMQGSRGALFKVRLTSHGYTVAAKCTVRAYISDLLHEAVVYKQLEKIQGIHIPVCLGNIDLPDFLAYNWAKFVHMMFLSWGGQSIKLHAELSNETHVMAQAVEAMRAIHQLGVLHHDAVPRNILWSEEVKHVIFIDFERSEIRETLSKWPRILNEQSYGDARENLIDWRNEMRSNMQVNVKEDDGTGSGALNFEILDEEEVDNKVEPLAFNASSFQILDEEPENKANPKQPLLTDFAREMMQMEGELVMLTRG